jgi:hypothetical protein
MAKADLDKLKRWAHDAGTILDEGVWEAEDSVHLAVQEIEALREVADQARGVLERIRQADMPTPSLRDALDAYETLVKQERERDAEDAVHVGPGETGLRTNDVEKPLHVGTMTVSGAGAVGIDLTGGRR